MEDYNNNSDLLVGNYSLLRKLEKELWKSLFPVTIYLSVLIIMGIIGNGLVILVWSKKRKHSSTDVCVLLLASFDLLTSFVGIPLDIYDLSIQYTSDNPALCKMSRFLIDISVYGSITVLVFIAILRFVKVCRPLKSFPVKSRGIIFISIGLGLGLSWPVLILHGLETRETRIAGVLGRGCGIDQHLRGSLYQNLYFSILAVIFVGACILLTVLYVCIAIHIYRRNQRRRTGTFGQANRPDKNLNVNKNNGKKTENRPLSNQSVLRYSVSTNSLMFFAITLAFVLSFLPSMVMLSIKAKRPHIESSLNDWQYAAYIFCFRTYFINNCINPILYGFWNRRFREESVKLMTNCRSGCETERQDNSTVTNNSLEKNPPGKQVTKTPVGKQVRSPSLSSFDRSLDFPNQEKQENSQVSDESVVRVARSKFYMQNVEPVAV